MSDHINGLHLALRQWDRHVREDDHQRAYRGMELAEAARKFLSVEYDNHHDALECPYCNPDGHVLVPRSQS